MTSAGGSETTQVLLENLLSSASFFMAGSIPPQAFISNVRKAIIRPPVIPFGVNKTALMVWELISSPIKLSAINPVSI
jgi:hypothetical protein